MVGRSTRKQGLQAGHVFCNDTVVTDEEPTFEYLTGREKLPNADNGPKYAKMLVTHWDAIHYSYKIYLGNTFSGNRWQMEKGTYDAIGMNPTLRAHLDRLQNTESLDLNSI